MHKSIGRRLLTVPSLIVYAAHLLNHQWERESLNAALMNRNVKEVTENCVGDVEIEFLLSKITPHVPPSTEVCSIRVYIRFILANA